MIVAVCEFNPTVGALEENANRIIDIYETIALKNPEVKIVVFPEMALTGYPIEDLALSLAFIADVEFLNGKVCHAIHRRLTGPALIFGTIMSRLRRPDLHTGPKPIAQNVALITQPGCPLQVVIKSEMANYGVFDEKRIFDHATGETNRVTIAGEKVGVLICEDGWHQHVPDIIIASKPEFVIWINASPFEYEKRAVRRETAKKHFAKLGKPVIYANMTGGQDELVFDGDSFIMNTTSLEEWLPVCSAAERFMSDAIHIFDTCTAIKEPANVPDSVPAIYGALVLGLRDYMRKQGFRGAVIGMSGGVDSACVAAIACDAIGPENVDLIGLPSNLSSSGSVDDATTAAEALGARYTTIHIEEIVRCVKRSYSANRLSLGGSPKPYPSSLTGIAAENVQARVRGLLLMAISNHEQPLLLTTGNKSEVSVGYSTLYGDMAGGFNPLKDCYKTTVWALCQYRNSLTEDNLLSLHFLGQASDNIVPRVIIDKPPSAELSEGQRDDQSLPPYHVLDPILKLIIEKHLGNDAIAKDAARNGMEGPALKSYMDMVVKVRGLVDRAEYKRRQAAPGIKITSKLHGRDRRVPIVNHWHG